MLSGVHPAVLAGRLMCLCNYRFSSEGGTDEIDPLRALARAYIGRYRGETKSHHDDPLLEYMKGQKHDSSPLQLVTVVENQLGPSNIDVAVLTPLVLVLPMSSSTSLGNPDERLEQYP
ncbi:hypothetical protein BASA50_006582 [Batrachochytrium salamandrivorans]|uniref:Uncharacterized protein n=1 Tax=Batrachochytrium salamandrivorans TaxID=1357716 RepID=A0ABQ8FAB1_9FUNG|nr:hypothetical protein BASA50_006582 [Batrachochytrium salamandrivorans]